MSKLITSAIVATVLLTGATIAQTRKDKGSDYNYREYICKQLQRNCT